jgi:hypothetical protein
MSITEEQLADIARRVDEAPDMLPPGTTILWLVEALRGERATVEELRAKLATAIGDTCHDCDEGVIETVTAQDGEGDATETEPAACPTCDGTGKGPTARALATNEELRAAVQEQMERADKAEAELNDEETLHDRCRADRAENYLFREQRTEAEERARRAEAEGAGLREALERLHHRITESTYYDEDECEDHDEVDKPATCECSDVQAADAALAGDVGRSFLEARARLRADFVTALDWLRALNWANDTGECRFCDYCEARPTHNETCPLAALDASKEGGK